MYEPSAYIVSEIAVKPLKEFVRENLDDSYTPQLTDECLDTVLDWLINYEDIQIDGAPSWIVTILMQHAELDKAFHASLANVVNQTRHAIYSQIRLVDVTFDSQEPHLFRCWQHVVILSYVQ